MSDVANRLSVVKPSASMAVSQAANALRATGVDMIDLGLGEPVFPTPRHVTGWRLGYAAGPAPLLKAMATVQSQSCTSIAAPGQAAAVAAVPGAAYGLSPVFRISTATSDAILLKAISRIASAVAKLQPVEVAA